jgi:hypothetical protein
MKTTRKLKTAYRIVTLLIVAVIMSTMLCAFAANATAEGYPDYEFGKATMVQIGKNGQIPIAVFTKNKGEGSVPIGAIVINADGTAKNKDSYMLFSNGMELEPGGSSKIDPSTFEIVSTGPARLRASSGAKIDPSPSGIVFFNIGDFPVKVGNYVLKKGEAVLYGRQKLGKITLSNEGEKLNTNEIINIKERDKIQQTRDSEFKKYCITTSDKSCEHECCELFRKGQLREDMSIEECFAKLCNYPSLRKASVSVTVKNETGYDLSEVKYVKEIGKAKSLAGQYWQIGNGSSYTFNLNDGGSYRVYASLIMDGKKVYAKGNSTDLQDGESYSLTLMKVLTSPGGSGLNFIDKSEFDAIK